MRRARKKKMERWKQRSIRKPREEPTCTEVSAGPGTREVPEPMSVGPEAVGHDWALWCVVASVVLGAAVCGYYLLVG